MAVAAGQAEPTALAAPRVMRRRLDREAERRRRAAAELRTTAALCLYASRQLADGLSPAEARDAALEMAGELTAVAEALRRAVRPGGPAERRATAIKLANLGVSTKGIAQRLGVTERVIRYYLTGRPCPGHRRPR
jgi:hypothetical protein